MRAILEAVKSDNREALALILLAIFGIVAAIVLGAVWITFILVDGHVLR